jgi:hypothetical protein
MSEQIRQQLDELFSAKQSGGMRVFLFSQFYEELLRQYFNHSEYDVCQGKPRIYWNKIEIPSTVHGDNCLRLVKNLKRLQQKASHCTPDGLFVKDDKYFMWEAKNWVQELYPSPFKEYAWNFAWLLAKQVEYKGKIHDLSGFIISWWEREPGMDIALLELQKQVSPMTINVVITKEVLQECIANQPEWYINLIKCKQKNIIQFFDVLLSSAST